MDLPPADSDLEDEPPPLPPYSLIGRLIYPILDMRHFVAEARRFANGEFVYPIGDRGYQPDAATSRNVVAYRNNDGSIVGPIRTHPDIVVALNQSPVGLARAMLHAQSYCETTEYFAEQYMAGYHSVGIDMVVARVNAVIDDVYELDRSNLMPTTMWAPHAVVARRNYCMAFESLASTLHHFYLYVLVPTSTGEPGRRIRA